MTTRFFLKHTVCALITALGLSLAANVNAAELVDVNTEIRHAQTFPHDAYINAAGTVIDPKTCAVLDIMRETHGDFIPADNNAEDVEQFFQTYLFKPATYFDGLRDRGEITEIPTSDQAERILALLDQDGHSVMPTLPAMSNLTLIVTMGVVKPTVSLRITDTVQICHDLTTAAHIVNRIVLSIPANIQPDVSAYLNELVPVKLTELNTDQLQSSVPLNWVKENMDTFSHTLSETDRILVLTDKTFYDKMSDFCASFGDKYLGAAYYYISEMEKAAHYGYDTSTELGLRNWGGNKLNFDFARNFDAHFKSWKKANS